MSCNCKSDKKMNDYLKDGESSESLSQVMLKYIFKSLVFLLLLVTLPIIVLFIIWFMFKMIVLNKEVNVKPLLVAIGKKFQQPMDDHEDDYEILTEDEVVMVDVEDITNRSK